MFLVFIPEKHAKHQRIAWKEDREISRWVCDLQPSTGIDGSSLLYLHLLLNHLANYKEFVRLGLDET